MTLSAGTRLGPYEVNAPVGAGGMGEVYRARDTRLDRTVAVKVLPAHLAESAEWRERFEREARAISSLNHPHVCVLHDVGHEDGVHFLVMEYVQGETLANRLAKGPLPVEQALEYARQIAGALAGAHRRGICHRDLKPGNIMLSKAGTKLLDFGLAKFMVPDGVATGSSVMATATDALTDKGTVLGTFQYMAPEQLEGGQTDARTDIFALGVVLYEMLTGRKAFQGATPASLIGAILHTDPPPLSSAQPLTPPSLDRLVRRCLAKDPDARWQNAQDLATELGWIAADVAQPASQSSTGTAKSQWHRRLERFAWAATCLLLLLAAVYSIRAHYGQPVQQFRSSLMPPRGFSFVPYNFSVSPDGTRLAFVAVGADGKNALWVHALSGLGSQQLSDAEDAAFPFWAPDSRRIGFFADGRLKIVDVAVGTVKTLCEAPSGHGGAWNRDDTIVFASSVLGGLHRVSATGGLSTPVTATSGPSAHRWPAFLPDGRHFLYFVDWSRADDPQGDGIYIASLDSADVRRILGLKGNPVFASGNLLYVRDRSLLAQPFDMKRLEASGPAVPIVDQELDRDTAFLQSGFSASDNGVLVFQSAADTSSRLVWFDRDGHEIGPLAETGCKDPRLSPDGRQLAVSSDDERNGKHFLRIYDERGLGRRLTEGGTDEFPTWSRDGKIIAYLTGAGSGSRVSINQIPADGSRPAQVLLEGGMMIPNDWSPDGNLLFMDFREGPVRLAVYSPHDRTIKSVTSEGGAEAQFSPDGKWIAYQETPNRGIVVQPYPGPGGRIQISSAGGAQPHWSRDGKRIFYIQGDKKLMEVSFDPVQKIAGAPRVLFQTPIVAPNFVLFQYDVAPDGRFLINSFMATSPSPLTLLTGWTALVAAVS